MGLRRAVWQNILQGRMGFSGALGHGSQSYCHKRNKIPWKFSRIPASSWRDMDEVTVHLFSLYFVLSIWLRDVISAPSITLATLSRDSGMWITHPRVRTKMGTPVCELPTLQWAVPRPGVAPHWKSRVNLPLHPIHPVLNFCPAPVETLHSNGCDQLPFTNACFCPHVCGISLLSATHP